MNREFWKKLFDESNLLIIIPAAFIVASLVVLLIFGLSDPKTYQVTEIENILSTQSASENDYLVEFSNGEYTPEDPYFVLNPYDISPLTGLLMFDTSEAKAYKVVIKGKTIDSFMEYTTDELISHIIPIYGLYPNFDNEVLLYELIDDDTYELVHTEIVKTGKLPSNIVLPSVLQTTSEYFGNDLMITMSNTSNMPVGYDINGHVRWYLNKELTWGPDQLENGNFIFGYRDLVNPYYNAEILEIDYLGKIYGRYNIPFGYHHDVTELQNGNLIVATNDFYGTVEDIIIEIDRSTGEIVKTIDMDNYLNMLDGTSEMWTLIDWFHLNSLYYDKNSNSLIVSGKNQDIVLSIDYETLKLNWIIGDPVNWDEKTVSDYFFTPIGEDFEWQYGQSDVEILGNGDVLIFDNGINKSKLRENDILPRDTYSRAVVYRLDEELMTIEQVFEYGKSLGNTFYSPEYSNVDVHGIDNYLIHSGENAWIRGELNILPGYELGERDILQQKSTTLEILDGVEVFRMEMEDSVHQAIRVSLYKNATNYSPVEGLNLGSQLVTREYIGYIRTKPNLLDTVPEEHEINFVKEFDRLVFTGNFKIGQEVYLVLEGNHETRKYLIPTEENPFALVCFEVCEDDLIEIMFFINEEEVSGKFNIYLVMNDKEYNTYKNVTFE
jgi:hypothetical protein